MARPAFFISNADVGSNETSTLTIGVAVSAHPKPSGNTGVFTRAGGAGASVRASETRQASQQQDCETRDDPATPSWLSRHFASSGLSPCQPAGFAARSLNWRGHASGKRARLPSGHLGRLRIPPAVLVVHGEDRVVLHHRTRLTWFDCITDMAVVSMSTARRTVPQEPGRAYKQKNLQRSCCAGLGSLGESP
jgi:hypothetical protein